MNSFWGLDFIISATILIVVAFTILYIYRDKIRRFFYKETNFDLFIKKLKGYLLTNHPKINFDFRIIENSQSEQNPLARCYIIIDNIINQFTNKDIKINGSNKAITQNNLWDSYTFNAKPIGNKLPDDWAKRKLIVAQRDKNICQRCGAYTKPETTHLFLVKSIKDGGQFYLENLVIICKNCHRVTTNKDLKYLDIRDNLNSLVV